MTCADGDGQRVHAGQLSQLDCLIGVGDVLQAGAARAVAVFNAAQHADLALDGDAALMRVIDHALGDRDVLFKAGRSLAVLF